MIGLTNKYVEDIGFQVVDNFLGVFPCDIQPDVSGMKTFSLIFNESAHNEEGTHFVCIYASKNRVYYFDSMGLSLENDYIKMFTYSCGRPVTLSRKQLQSFESNFCGFFCLCFLIYMSQDRPFNNFFRCFSSNLKVNDVIVIEFIKNMLK
jgi:hypothetical protein